MEKIKEFFKRRWWIILLVLIATPATILYTINQWDHYRFNRARMTQLQKMQARQADQAASHNLVSDPNKLLNGSRMEPAPNTTPDQAGTIPHKWIYQQPALPKMTNDILAKLKIKLVNEFVEPVKVPNEWIRGAADYAFSVIQVTDPTIKGWTLYVRPANDVAQTSFIPEHKSIVIEIDIRQMSYSLTHELVHVLLGMATHEAKLPGFVNEFIATAAEINSPPSPPQLNFDYDRLNRRILGISRSLTQIEGKIGHDSPLDLERYTLLRYAGQKIGPEAYHALAVELAKAALTTKTKLSMADIQPYFERFGLGDCVLFTQTPGPGIYVDLAMTIDGLPYVMYKQVDLQGIETSINSANIRITLKRGKTTIYNFPIGSTSPEATFLDPAGMQLFPYADKYEVTVGTLTYVWKIDQELDKSLE